MDRFQNLDRTIRALAKQSMEMGSPEEWARQFWEKYANPEMTQDGKTHLISSPISPASLVALFAMQDALSSNTDFSCLARKALDIAQNDFDMDQALRAILLKANELKVFPPDLLIEFNNRIINGYQRPPTKSGERSWKYRGLNLVCLMMLLVLTHENGHSLKATRSQDYQKNTACDLVSFATERYDWAYRTYSAVEKLWKYRERHSDELEVLLTVKHLQSSELPITVDEAMNLLDRLKA